MDKIFTLSYKSSLTVSVFKIIYNTCILPIYSCVSLGGHVRLFGGIIGHNSFQHKISQRIIVAYFGFNRAVPVARFKGKYVRLTDNDRRQKKRDKTIPQGPFVIEKKYVDVSSCNSFQIKENLK